MYVREISLEIKKKKNRNTTVTIFY